MSSAWKSVCWNRDDKASLIFGYIRRTVQADNSKLDIPDDLKLFILRFYDEVIYWSFKQGKDMQMFLNFPNSQELKGPKLEMPQHITLQNTLSPNGYSPEQAGYVEYYCDCVDAPEDQFIVTVYIVFSCKQTKYQHKTTVWFKYKEDWTVWAGICMPLKDVVDAGYKSLDFGCYAELLHVEYFNELESDQDEEDITLDPSRRWTVDISMHKHFEFEWIINGEQLRQIQNAKIGQHFYSENFNKDAFCMYISPRGWIPDNENRVSFQVKLLRLPIQIVCMQVDISLEAEFLNHRWRDQIMLSYEEQRSGWPAAEEYEYSSELLAQHTEIKIKVTLQIEQIYDSETSELVEMDEAKWAQYGIVQ